MDIKTALAAAPWARRAWRVVPGPLKLPLLVAGGAYALYTMATGKEESAEADGVTPPQPRT